MPHPQHQQTNCKRSWAEWQATGQDSKSMIADPLFRGVQHERSSTSNNSTERQVRPPLSPADFTLALTSPAIQVGFDPQLVTAVVGTVGPSAAARFDWKPWKCEEGLKAKVAENTLPGGSRGEGTGTGERGGIHVLHQVAVAAASTTSSSSSSSTSQQVAVAGAYQCDEPGVPGNGSVSGNGIWACGDVAVWHCDVGSVLTGATFAYCEGGGNNGGWSSPPPKCAPSPLPTCLETGSAVEPDHLVADGAPSHSLLRSPRRGFFITQQDDGNLCVYKGSGPGDNKGLVWCSGGADHHLPAQPFATVLQTDGNLCTYSSTSTGHRNVWCSNTPVCKAKACSLWASLGDDGRFCIHRTAAGATCPTTLPGAPTSTSSSPPVWCSPHS